MRVLRYALGSTIGLMMIAAVYLWWVLLSPFGYERPEDLAVIPEGESQVFVYGTLTHAPVRWLVYGRAGSPEAAILPGFRKRELDLVAQQGHQVEGLVLNVSEEELAALDRYERLGYRYERVRVQIADGSDVWVYMRL